MANSRVNELFPELLTNPVGWSRRAPAQFLSAAPANELFDPMTSVLLPGAQRPLTQNELAGARDYSLRLFDAAADAAGGVAGPQVPGAKSVMLGRLRNRARWVPPSGGPIKTWHASPHAFDKFDLSKMGTGEGAQMVGYGMYFGDNMRTGNSYYNKFAKRNPRVIGPEGPIVNPLAGANYLLPKGMPYNDAPLRAAFSQEELDRLLRLAKRSFAGYMSHDADGALRLGLEALLRGEGNGAFSVAGPQILARLERAGLVQPTPSHLYRVQLNTSPQNLLDIDRTLAKQPLLDKMTVEDAREYFDLAPFPFDRQSNAALAEQMRRMDRDIAMKRQGLAPLLGKEFIPHNAKQAEVLRQLDIPGLQYLDAGSRPRERFYGDSGGTRTFSIPQELRTRNYVVWDPAIIQILKRSQPVLGPVSAGVAGNMLFGGQSDARE